LKSFLFSRFKTNKEIDVSDRACSSAWLTLLPREDASCASCRWQKR